MYRLPFRYFYASSLIAVKLEGAFLQRGGCAFSPLSTKFLL